MLTKKEAENLMKIKGEVRGEGLVVNCKFVLEKGGEQALKKIESRMVELGYPLKCEEIKPMDFYPVGLAPIFALVIKEFFNLDEKGLEEWGRALVKFSLFMKIFMKYFVSLNLVVRQVPNIWQKNFTIGDLEVPEFNKESKYIILRLKKFKLDPLYCSTYKGWFSKTAEMVLRYPVTIKETKCMFKGDKYHEFLLTW